MANTEEKVEGIIADTESIDDEKTVDDIKNDDANVEIEEVDTTSNDVDEVVKDESKDEEIPIHRIDRVVPLTILAKKNYQGHTIESLVLLGHDSDEDKFVAFIHNYITYDYDTVDIIKTIPFHSDNNFISEKMVASMLLNSKYVDSYITDFKFDLDDEMNTVKLLCNPNKSGKQTIFEFSNNLFSSISFIDNYIADPITNNHDISVATAHGYDDSKEVKIFRVSELKEILSMAEVDKKSTTISLVLKVADKEDNIAKILCSFNVGKRFPRSKFKKATVEYLERGFLVDGDQYLEEYMFTAQIKNEDKEYTIIRGTNKNNESKLFLFGIDDIKKLETMIEEY